MDQSLQEICGKGRLEDSDMTDMIAKDGVEEETVEAVKS